MSGRGGAAREDRQTLATCGLAVALAALRVASWDGPVTTNFLANAAMLLGLWILWANLVSEIVNRVTRPLESRHPRLRAFFSMILVLVAVAAPELGLRAHEFAAAQGLGRQRVLVYLAVWIVAAGIGWLLLAWILRIPRLDRRVGWAVGAVGLVIGPVLSRTVGPDSSDATGPNVLLVVVDALRADVLGCYGDSLGASPNLDRLARGGWRFENAFSTASSSVPGHTSILWGEEVPEHGALTNEFDLPDSLGESLPARLRRRGYRTFAVCQNPLVSAAAGFGRDFDHYWSWFEPDMAHADWHEALWQFAPVHWWRELRETEPISQRTRHEVRGRAPWMGFVQFLYCHDPYEDGDGWVNEQRVSEIESLLDDGTLRNTTTYPEREVAEFIAKYHGALAYVDRLVGDILDALPSDERERTLVVVTADHGENLAEHGDSAIGKHFGYYQTSLRVPLIVSGLPAVEPQVVGAITGTDRIADLVCDLVDRRPVLALADAHKSRHVVYSQPWLVSLDATTKLVLDASDPERPAQSFHWPQDPWDEFPAPPDSSAETRRRLAELRKDLSKIDVRMQEHQADVRPEKLRRLKALGYVE